jgi:predicted MPP superfamily phosphohydrolase
MGVLSPDQYPRLLLTHSPQTVVRLRPGEVDLALAGHTHGGQIFVPIVTALLLVRAYSRFSHGLYWFRGTAVYVNRGLGSLGVPARFLRRPEVTVLTLRSPVLTPPAAGSAGSGRTGTARSSHG